MDIFAFDPGQDVKGRSSSVARRNDRLASRRADTTTDYVDAIDVASAIAGHRDSSLWIPEAERLGEGRVLAFCEDQVFDPLAPATVEGELNPASLAFTPVTSTSMSSAPKDST